jgi:phosphoribosylglycinamide formyltransferase 1
LNALTNQLHIAVFASGRGSNFGAVLEKIRSGEIPDTNIAVVISNSSTAGALEIARSHSIPALHYSRTAFGSDEEFTDGLRSLLSEYGVNMIILAGYMKLLPQDIVKRYHHRILNVHPALLPAFGGKGMFGRHVHEAVIAYGTKVSGATVHIVDEEYDHGPVVLQECVAVDDNDSPDSLAEKVLKIEHRLLPEAVKLFAEGRITVHDRRVFINRKSPVASTVVP